MIEEIPGDLLQWLRGFYFVAEKGSVTQATLLMGREQPTISRQIQCLEKELGVTLFDRSSGKMRLTPEGRIVFEKAISLFEDVKEMKNDLRKEKLEYQGRIVIAASHTIIDSFLPPYILEFRRTRPRVRFHMEGGIVETVFEKVESADVDFGIAYVESVPQTMVCYDLFETGQKLIAPKNNTFFSGKKHPSLRQVARAPLILFSSTGAIEPYIERRFAREGLKPNVVMTHNNLMSVKKYVTLGLGAALVSDFAVSREEEKTIDVFPMDRYFARRKYGLLLRKKKYISPVVKAFIRTIKPGIESTK
jgi:DNA-binding transcriptional LysR family regulator